MRVRCGSAFAREAMVRTLLVPSMEGRRERRVRSQFASVRAGRLTVLRGTWWWRRGGGAGRVGKSLMFRVLEVSVRFGGHVIS